jgi:hypothetical protein
LNAHFLPISTGVAVFSPVYVLSAASALVSPPLDFFGATFFSSAACLRLSVLHDPNLLKDDGELEAVVFWRVRDGDRLDYHPVQ